MIVTVMHIYYTALAKQREEKRPKISTTERRAVINILVYLISLFLMNLFFFSLSLIVEKMHLTENILGVGFSKKDVLIRIGKNK